MARPMKRRRVCGLPAHSRFGPPGRASGPPIILAVDEYETIRLIDLLGLSQEECALQMGVARTTVQGIYQSARRKIAQALVEGQPLVIQGGEYHLCEDTTAPCGNPCGRRRRGRGQGGSQQ